MVFSISLGSTLDIRQWIAGESKKWYHLGHVYIKYHQT